MDVTLPTKGPCRQVFCAANTSEGSQKSVPKGFFATI